MIRKKMHRHCAVALASLAVTSVFLLSTPAANAVALGPPGSSITYEQVMDRAADWYHRAPAYSGTTYIWDYGHTRRYRTDCSGLVDMALHLATDANTEEFADPSRSGDFHKIATVRLHARSYFNYNTVHTGDFFDDLTDRHMWLFAYWGADHKHFAYYNFGGGDSGVAPPELHHAALFTDDSLGFEPTVNYVQYRYARITAS